MIISVSVSKEDLTLIDDYRGDIPRSTFLVRSALKEVGVHEKDIDSDCPKGGKPLNPKDFMGVTKMTGPREDVKSAMRKNYI